MQFAVNVAVAAAYYFLVAAAVSLVVRVEKFIDFSAAAGITISAYAFITASNCSFNPMIGLAGSLITVFIYTTTLHGTVFAKLVATKAPSHVLMIASLGLYIVTQNVVSIVHGDATRTIFIPLLTETYALGSASMTVGQVLLVIAAMGYGIGLAAFLKFTAPGLSVRATMDHAELAHLSGITPRQIAPRLWAGAALGLSGAFQATEFGVDPVMGMPLLLAGAVAAFFSGNMPVIPLAVSALSISFVQRASAYQLPFKWQDSITYALVGIFLISLPNKHIRKLLHKHRY
jgi:branched-chain amino acid transport system permease protein